MNQLDISGSGIQGDVIIRPLSPIERPGTINYRPYQATITVLDENGQTVTEFQSAADGRFQVSLEPGIYVLRPESGQTRPWSQKQTVTVPKNEFIDVRIAYDSGIR